jgi:hypothetical protein
MLKMRPPKRPIQSGVAEAGKKEKPELYWG